MQRISYCMMTITLYIFLSGCGLVAFPPKEILKENQQTSQHNQHNPQKNMLRSSDKSSNQPVQMVMKKTDDKLFDYSIQEKIIIVINQEQKLPPTKVADPIKVVPIPEPSTNNPTPIPPKPTKEETTPENGEEQPPQQDEKYQAALKKAEELKGTDQQVTADQGNVYENPEEKANIIGQVLKNQKLHIDNTKVDNDDAEIWCFVSGNDGQKDIIGWVSYQIIEQK
jgi:hypothetical protein